MSHSSQPGSTTTLDIQHCIFVGSASPELYTRWLQLGVFYPFMRSHSDLGSPDKEPWSFGSQYEVFNKQMVELRYQLLPYIYNVMQQASETGVPAMRPIFLEFPEDEESASIDDEFLFGADLLVAPVLWQGAAERELYLPKGDWYDYWTGRRYAGGHTIRLPVSLDSLPLFVRAGAFIFRQPVVQNTGEMPGKPLRILIAPAPQSESALYEDDGESLDYRKGRFLKRHFRQITEKSSTIVEVSAPEGSYRPAPRNLILETWADREPQGVSMAADKNPEKLTPLPRMETSALSASQSGWSYEDNTLIVKSGDRFIPQRFIIQR